MLANEPLATDAAKTLIRSILENGIVAFSSHALEELRNDSMTTADALNVLRGGVVRPGEQERGTWRYRVQTSRMTIVVAFRSESEMVVVTGWKMGR